MSDNDVIVALVVTYNRLSDLRACLDAIRRQTRVVERVLVVDNASTDGTSDFLDQQADVTVVRLAQNLGGSGGFRHAIDLGVTDGATYLWVMDDDCLPEDDALEHLALAAARCDASANVAGFVPTVAYGSGVETCGYVRDAPVAEGECDWGPFLGLLLASDACRAAGPVRDDFFIIGDDTEYCLRMRLLGWHFRTVPLAIVRHPMPDDLEATFRGHTYFMYPLAPWKQYYAARNLTLVDRATRGTIVAATPPRFGSVFRTARAVALLLLLDRKWGWRRAVMHVWGTFDAVGGKTGPVVAPGQSLPRRRRVTDVC
ncbi:MAG: glycosyltransferase [Solirubrobacteraceae bacterium]